MFEVRVHDIDRVRVARVGLAGSSTVPGRAVAWNAAHGGRRDDAALFLTGDEGLVELAAVVEYRYGRAAVGRLLFGVAALDPAGTSDPVVSVAAEAAFRDALGAATVEAVLVGARPRLEADIRRDLEARLARLEARLGELPEAGESGTKTTPKARTTRSRGKGR